MEVGVNENYPPWECLMRFNDSGPKNLRYFYIKENFYRNPHIGLDGKRDVNTSKKRIKTYKIKRTSLL